MLHCFHYELHPLGCHLFATEILLPTEISTVGSKGSNTPRMTYWGGRDETAAEIISSWPANSFFAYPTSGTPCHPCSYGSQNSSFDCIDISSPFSKADCTRFQIQDITSYLAPHTNLITSKMLSRKSSCYSSSIKFLLDSAYQKKFSDFSSVSTTSLLPFHQAQWDTSGAPLHTLPVLTTDSHTPEKKSSLSR